MTSKIFKSSYMSDSSRLEIETSIASTSFHITHCTVVSEKSFIFDNTTAPALALAILEAAGTPMNLDVSLGKALYHLDAHVTLQDKATAEAKEQAELEAEALDLFNLWLAGFNYEGYSEWTGENAELKGVWLAVARKAREMRKS